MLSHEKLQELLEAGAKVFGSDGEKIGTLGHIYLDDGTGLPDFATLHTGFLGTAENFVPLTGAEISEEQLYVKFPKSVVKDAPNIDPDGNLSPEDEDRLYHYYSRAGLGSPAPAADPATLQFAGREREVHDGTPRGQTPEAPPTDNSERTQTMRAGVPDPLDP